MKKYQVRTDLAIESVENITDEYNVEEKVIDNIKITEIIIDESYEEKLNKKKGTYITIEFDDVTDYNNRQKIIKVFTSELRKLMNIYNISEDFSCLVIGLGNEKSTPDSLGPNTIDNILVTKHLFELNGNNVEEGFRCVSAFNPGVMGVTGIETSEVIKSLIGTVNPDFVIAVDALAASAISRVNRTIQMTNSGIHPGSGVGNNRKELSYDTLGIPVIAIGIPTVVDAVTIVSDTINYMEKHFSYVKDNIDSPSNKLKVGNSNYIKKENLKDLNKSEKKKYMGFLGELDEEEVKSLVYEVLSPINYNLMVTPKEVDFVVDKLSLILSEGINKSLHKKVLDSGTN